MRRLPMTVLLVLCAPLVLAAGWNKPYFGATPPGSWATYEQKGSQGPSSTSTVTRLADEDGRVRIEEATKFAADAYPPSTQRYEMAKGFSVAQDLIDYPKALVAVSMAAGNAKLELMPAPAIESMKTVMNQYGPTAAFKAAETVAGKSCDRYSYSIKSNDGRVETGDLWLDATVPFGVVKHTTTTKDAAGKVLWTTERTLLDSGTKTLAPTTTAAAPAPLTLKTAYDAGLIYVNVEIDPKFKDGRIARLIIESKSAAPLALTVPKGTTSFHVDIPFDDFVFDPGTVQTLNLTGAKSAELLVTQLGEVRAVAGKFRIHTDEGKPYFSGSATTGFVK